MRLQASAQCTAVTQDAVRHDTAAKTANANHAHRRRPSARAPAAAGSTAGSCRSCTRSRRTSCSPAPARSPYCRSSPPGTPGSCRRTCCCRSPRPPSAMSIRKAVSTFVEKGWLMHLHRLCPVRRCLVVLQQHHILGSKQPSAIVQCALLRTLSAVVDENCTDSGSVAASPSCAFDTAFVAVTCALVCQKFSYCNMSTDGHKDDTASPAHFSCCLVNMHMRADISGFLR